jgi:hypothetical protein
MSKKPAASLSASLVAIKGAAAPAADMLGRGTPLPVPTAPAPEEARPAPQRGATREGKGDLTPLNFRVRGGFRREFKTYAAQHDLKLNELLRRSFEAYRRQNGD